MSATSADGLLAVTGSMMALSIISVGLRFCARKQQKLPLATDDWMALAGVMAYIGAAISVFLMVHDMSLGYPSSSFTLEQTAAMAPTFGKLEITFDIFTNTALACVKLSILFFYRRVFGAGMVKKGFNIITMTTIVIVVLWLVVFQFLTGFQCGTHLSALWSEDYLQYCTISFPFLYGLAISDFLLDIWILALPVPLIMRLHTSRARKLSITGIFLLAFVGLGASIARMVTYITVELGGPTYFLYNDEELTDTKAVYTTMLAAGMSLLAVNLPSLWHLCTNVIPSQVLRSVRSVLSLRSSHSNGSGSNGPGLAGATGGGPSATRIVRKPGGSAETLDSVPPLPDRFGGPRYKSDGDSYQFRDDLVGGRKFEVYAMHTNVGEEEATAGKGPKGDIRVHNAVEVRNDVP